MQLSQRTDEPPNTTTKLARQRHQNHKPIYVNPTNTNQCASIKHLVTSKQWKTRRRTASPNLNLEAVCIWLCPTQEFTWHPATRRPIEPKWLRPNKLNHSMWQARAWKRRNIDDLEHLVHRNYATRTEHRLGRGLEDVLRVSHVELQIASSPFRVSAPDFGCLTSAPPERADIG